MSRTGSPGCDASTLTAVGEPEGSRQVQALRVFGWTDRMSLRRCSMRWKRFLVLATLVLAVSCNLPRDPVSVAQTVPVAQAVTASPQASAKASETSTRVWTGKTFRVETKNLLIDYPDFIDPDQARLNAEALQKVYDTYLVIFAFGDEQPFQGQKTTIVFDPKVRGNSASGNQIIIGSGTLGQIKDGYLNPPDRTFLHELAHVFEYAQISAGRYYIFNVIIGINEAFTEYLVCYQGIYPLWAQGKSTQEYCDLILHGVGAKGPEFTLTYYEDERIDPYTLDWGSHPAGASGEGYFEQMLARVSDKVGWDVWQKYFSSTKDSGGSPAAREAYETRTYEMGAPLSKQVFAEFVSDLSRACGQDLRPLFRGWGFEL